VLPIVVLAGGLGTRLGALTQQLPKCLIEINGKPFVHWQVSALRDAGYEYFVFCVSHKSSLVMDFLGDGSRLGVKIEYSLDGEKQLGTGGALKGALNLLGPDFGVIYGDSYLPINYFEVEENFLNRRTRVLMTVFKNSNQNHPNNVYLKADQSIFYNKHVQDPRMKHIDYGLMYMEASVFGNTEPNSFFDLADLLSNLSDLEEVTGFEVYNSFYEIGSEQGIKEFSKFLREGHNEF